MALFNEGGLYAGNTGWYDIVRDAQDGDSITAFLPNGNGTSIQGAFGRTDQGRITVDMGHNQIVDESVFATFGGRRSGMSAQYGWASDTATPNPFPFVGSASGGVQILYDIFDPFIPRG